MTERVLNTLCRGLHGAIVSYVGNDANNLRVAQTLAGIVSSCLSLIALIDDAYMATLASKLLSDGQPDPARAAQDDGDLAIEVQFHDD
jgi:hypothetical protein